MSHEWIWLSSEPQIIYLPDLERTQDVNPELAVGGLYSFTCWSLLISHILAVLSSDPVPKAWPEGWNWKKVLKP